MITADTKNDIYAQLDLNVEQQDLINRVSLLARENFAARAAEWVLAWPATRWRRGSSP